MNLQSTIISSVTPSVSMSKMPRCLYRLATFPLAILTTLALLWGMQSLVHQPTPVYEEKPSPTIPNVRSHVKKIETFHSTEEALVKPQIVELPPTLIMEPPIAERGGPDFIHTRVKLLPGEGTAIGVNIDTGGKPMPIVRINPAYPANALSRGIEGYVDVEFEITALGTTSNIRILAYEPSSVFNSSVLKAVRGWKYRPVASDNGGAEPSRLVRERIKFSLEN